MQYIDGIPLITDPDADAALFGSLFPQGFAQSQTAFQNVRRTPILDYEWQFLKRSVDDTHDALFMLATPETFGNVTLQQEPGTQVDFRKEDFTLYHEVGVSNGRYDPGIDIIDATVSVIVLKDGVLAEKLWKETSVESHQAIFFIENNESDWSSAKMFARFGEFAKKKLLALDRGNSVLMEFLRSLPEVDNDVIQQLLNHGQVETKVGMVKKAVTGIMQLVSYVAGGPGKIVGPWCEKAGNYILENIQIPESVWNSQSDEYSKREKLQEKLMLGNDLSGLLASINDSILLMPVRYVAPELLDRLKNGAEQFLAEFVAQYNSMVSDALKKMFGNTGSDEEPDISFLREYTAYLCGICNGLIDFVGGTLVFAGQLMQFHFDFAQDADAYLERFDSFMASVKPYFGRILTAIRTALANPKDYFSKFDTADINWDKVAYCAGYTGAFIASFFIPFAAFAKPAATAAKLKKGLAPAEMLADISSKTAKVSKFVMDGSRRAAGQMLEFLDDILKLMALGLEELTAFLKDIFRKMAEWLMKNKKAITKQLILVNDATEFIRKYTLTTARHLNYGEVKVKKIDPKLTNKDPGWILEEYSYSVSRTGKGGKTPLKKFNYKVTVGGVHNLNNLSRYVRIKGKLNPVGKLPTGEKVYKGLVEFWVKELKAWKPKDLASTFFPKSWSEEKIRKVIQEASLNIYEKKGNRFRGIAKNGAKIEFRIDKTTGEITTAFIIF